MRAAVPPRQDSRPPPPEVETTVASPEDDVARMVARRKALLGRAIGLRRDVVAEHVPDLDSTYKVTQEMKDQFGPPPATLLPVALAPNDKMRADRDAESVCWSSTRRLVIPAWAGIAWRT